MDNKISIIIPAYNIESCLSATLDSILSQTYKKIEVIVVNDGSTDGTGNVINNYANRDSRVKAIHKANGGVTSARLRGVSEATGEWIGFVDGDDMIEPDMYERLIKNAEAHHAQISHCGYQMIFPDGHIDYYYNTGDFAVQDRTTALRELLSGARIEPGLWNKLFHRSLLPCLSQKEAVPPDIKINEDLLMNFRLFSAAKQTVYEDFCPYHYILRSGSAATTKKAHHLTDAIRVRQIMRDELLENEALYPTAEECYLRALIRAAAQTDWPDIALDAKKQLRHEIRTGALGYLSGIKLRGMVLTAAYLTPVYRIIRRRYNDITGISHKYDL